MKNKKAAISIFISIIIALSITNPAVAATEEKIKTKIKLNVEADEYENWEGVSNVSQFIGKDGEFWFAYNGKDKVTVVNTVDGRVGQKTELPKQHSLFGAVCSDNDGNYYVVTGEENTGDDAGKETVFISKYDSNGNLITTVGDNGASSLASYYDVSGFATKIPFRHGNCDVAVNGGYLAVDYARTMYNNHQSNSVWLIATESMNTVSPPEFDYFSESASLNRVSGIYNSHSFGQRAVNYNDGFLFMSEGDAYNRAFTLHQWNIKDSYIKQDDIFHFWIKPGSSEDMKIVNNNYAHMGDIAVLSDGTAAFAATSVKSLDSNADNESEQLFIQVFSPDGDLGAESGYRTSGMRKGTSGINGGEEVTDYGVKWLTDDGKYIYKHPQMVSMGDKFVILYEKYAKKTLKYKGVYYMVLDSTGNIVQESRKFKKAAKLNPCETPVYTKGSIYWVANKGTKKGKVFIHKLTV